MQIERSHNKWKETYWRCVVSNIALWLTVVLVVDGDESVAVVLRAKVGEFLGGRT